MGVRVRSERKLPEGATFQDKDGTERDQARLRWWNPAPATLGEAMLFQGAPEGLDIGVPYERPEHTGYPETAPPVFFGHYWRSGQIRAERPNAACLDYSVAKANGRLVAYRWEGERRIHGRGFFGQEII